MSAEKDKRKNTDEFRRRVYDVVATIPEGKVTTYGAIARHIGAAASARAVGSAMMAVPDDLGIPCHRVVNKNGSLSGSHHFATPTLMRDLLEEENVKFRRNVVVMEEHFWDPAEDGQ